MRLCVKTKVQHLITKSFKVILKGKVFVIRAKEVTGWVRDFREENSSQSEDASDNNFIGIQNLVDAANDDDDVIPDSFQSNVNENSNVKDNANEGNHVERTQEQLYVPSGDLFGLEDLILKSSKKVLR
nr:RNA-directed DNA polymerase, eukaryota [Tanacetum cinerariifolium]